MQTSPVTEPQHYEIAWGSNTSSSYDAHTVNLMLTPELVEKAKWETKSVDTPSRDELCRQVRVAANVLYPEENNELITFADLIITLRS